MVALLLALTCLLRLLHVFTGYYVLNPDSFYFHQLAEDLMAGTYVPIEGSGLVYPVAGLGAIIGIKAASIIFPLFLAVVMGGLLHWFTERYWGRTAAHWSLFCYAVAWPALMIGYAGMLDRDLLSVLLVMIAVFDAPATRPWLTFLSMVALFILWGWLGVAVVLALLIGICVITRLLKKPVQYSAVIWLMILWAGVILLLKHTAIWEAFTWTFNNHVSESQHNAFYELAAYWPVMIPLGAGLAVAVRRKEAFLIAWALTAFLMGFVSQRLMIFGIPAFLIMCGIGFEFVWQRSRKIALVAVAMGLILGLALAVWPPNNLTISRDWQAACRYLRHETPEGSMVMSSWDNGYWILDVAERSPYCDNGVHTTEQDARVFGIYCAVSDYQAYELARGQTDYVVFSKREARVWPIIIDTVGYNGDREDTFYYRVSQGWDSAYFETVYRNKTVVVLEVK